MKTPLVMHKFFHPHAPTRTHLVDIGLCAACLLETHRVHIFYLFSVYLVALGVVTGLLIEVAFRKAHLELVQDGRVRTARDIHVIQILKFGDIITGSDHGRNILYEFHMARVDADYSDGVG